jgi:hypothetical protein
MEVKAATGHAQACAEHEHELSSAFITLRVYESWGSLNCRGA